MKIAEYNEMMAYLTRPEPEVLPQPKPQKLLDIQEKNKIERQQDTMDKASPFLMDESVDFIERQNFSTAGLVKTLLRKIPVRTGVERTQPIKNLLEHLDQEELQNLLQQSFVSQ